jgi:Ca2+-binding EF-hand superfamily protein
VPHEIPKYDRQIREALKKFDWDASGGLRFQELAKVFKQPGTETGTGTPMTPEQIKV